MKISLLLMRYFYQTRKLRLPGLGVFTLDKNIAIPQLTENQEEVPNGAQFQKVPVAAADPDLIAFICENTGKIKPLASADLESFLGLGIEMMHIGKPFLLEGIGTITRQPAGRLEFTSGSFGLMPVEGAGQDTGSRSAVKPVTKQTNEPAKISTTSQTRPPSMALADHRNLLKGVALLAAVLIIGGGGYLLYRNRSAATGFSDSTVAVAGIMTAEDKASSLPDAVPVTAPAAPAPEVTPVAIKPVDSAEMRFVILSTPNKAHALRRYTQLQSFDLKPKLFQKDSAWFKVYFEFPARFADTLHIKDSLHRQYDANVSIDR